MITKKQKILCVLLNLHFSMTAWNDDYYTVQNPPKQNVALGKSCNPYTQEKLNTKHNTALFVQKYWVCSANISFWIKCVLAL